MDSLRQVLPEEIALEGLDGITLETLFVRLANRLETKFDDLFKNEIWKIVKRLQKLDYYEIAADRPTPQVFHRPVEEDNEEFESFFEKDYGIYSFDPVESPDVRGSCKEFATRVPIPLSTLQNLDLAEVKQKYSNKLVIVASQTLRSSVLMPNNLTTPSIEFSNTLYCVLERVARSRYLGELSTGPCSLQNFVKDTGNLFYIRRELLNMKLIMRHSFEANNRNPKKTLIMRTLLFLPKYFTIRKHSVSLTLQKIHNYLKSMPGHKAPVFEVTKLALPKGVKYARKLIKSCPNFRIESIPYSEFKALTQPDKIKKDDEKMKKQVNTVCLVDPDIESDLVKLQDDEDEVDAETEGFLNVGNRVMNVPLIHQIYRRLDEAGSDGLSQNDIAVHFGLSRLNSRAAVKTLKRNFDIKFYSQDEGRQRTFKYVLAKNATEKTNAMEIDAAPAVKESKAKVQPGAAVTAEKLNENLTFAFDTLDKAITVQLKRILSVPGYENSLQDIKNNNNLTSKTKSRIKIILETIKKRSVIDLNGVLIEIKRHESDSKEKMCRKSLSRLVSSLATENYIKLMQMEMKIDMRLYNMYLFCKEDVEFDYDVLKPIIEDKIMFSQTGPMKGIPPALISEKEMSEMSSFGDLSSTSLPKFIKFQKFHEFLFYMAYECDKQYKQVPVASVIDKWKKENSSLANAGEMEEEIKFCSSETLNWKTFITPLKHRDNVPEGWCLLRDVMYRIPLVVLFEILTKSLEKILKDSPQYNSILNHPIKRNYLLHYLPESVRRNLFPVKYLNFLFMQLSRKLCLMGLLKFGPVIGKENDNNFIFINRNASLMDTKSSGHGHLSITDKEYPSQRYVFNDSSDLKTYWKDLGDISLGTHLGYKLKKAKPSEYKEITMKTSLQHHLKPIGFNEAVKHDNGEIPGDHRGAGGLDTAFYTFQRRNWLRSSDFSLLKHHRSVRSSEKIKRVITKRIVAQARNRSVKRSKSQIGSFSQVISKSRKDRSVKSPLDLDDVDREALKLARTSRAVWYESEDKTLILIKVALRFMFKEDSPILDYTVVRDILHWKNEKSLDKTTKMCIRRIVNLLKNTSSKEKIVLYLEELENDPDVYCRYRNAAERLKKKHSPVKYQEVVKIAIVEFVILLHHMFYKRFKSDTERVIKIHLPNDYAEIHKSFVMKSPEFVVDYDFKEPNTLDEVEISTYTSFIISVINMFSQNVDYVNQVLDVARSLDDMKVKAALFKLRKMAMISLSKRDRVMKSSIDSYHLSPRYSQVMMLHMPVTVFSEVKDAISKLSQSNDHPLTEDTCGWVLLLSNLMLTNQIEFTSEKVENLVSIDPNVRKKSRFTELSDHYIKTQTTKIQGKRRVRIAAGKDNDEGFTYNEDPVEWFLKINVKYLHIFCILVNMSEDKEMLIKKFELLDTEWCCLDTCIFQDELDFENVVAGIAENFNGVVGQILDNDSEVAQKTSGITKTNLISFYDDFMKTLMDTSDLDTKDYRLKVFNKREKVTTRQFLEKISALTTFIPAEDGWLQDYQRSSKQNDEESVVDEDEMSTDRIIFRRLPNQLKDPNVARKANDSYVINFSTVNVQLNSSMAISDPHQNAVEELLKYSVWTADELKDTTMTSKFDSTKRKIAESLCKFINSKAHQGATIQEIKQEFDKSKKYLVSVVETLVTNKDIVRVGIVNVRFVSKTFAHHWMIGSYRKNTSEEAEPAPKKVKLNDVATNKQQNQSINLSPMPWSKIDGTLNNENLNLWLSTLLSHINLNPGIFISDLTKKFNVIKPMEVRTLCEILQRMECVELKSIKMQEINAFSQFDCQVDDVANMLCSNEEVFVELQPNAVIKFSFHVKSSTE